MSTPIIVGPVPSPAPFPIPIFDCIQFGISGPYPKPGTTTTFYLVGVEDKGNNNNTSLNFGAYKSTDSGTTWVKVATGPDIFGSLASLALACVSYPGTGNLIYGSYQKDATPGQPSIAYSAFDMSSETFSVESVVAVSPPFNGTNFVGLDELNRPLVAWDLLLPSGHYGVRAATLSGGVWTTFQVTPNDTNDYLLEIVTKTATDGQVLYSKWDSHFLNNRVKAFLAKITGSAVASTYTLTADPTNWWLTAAAVGPGLYNAANDKLGLPVVLDFSFSRDEVHMITVSNPEGAPSDTDTTVYVAPTDDDDIGDVSPPFVVSVTSGFQVFWRQEKLPAPTRDCVIKTSTSPSLSGPWSVDSVYYDPTVTPPSPPPPVTVLSNKIRTYGGVSVNGVASLYYGVIWSAGGVNYQFTMYAFPPPAPPVVPAVAGMGGRGFIHFSLTAFDGCLGREYRMYEQIDRQLLSCGIKPACFCIDERDWGTHNDDDEMIPGAPSGSAAFNPSGQIVLPTTVSGDNVIFKFTVPVGYDGMILGQFHGYYKTPTGGVLPPSFIEGSGDIIWRLSANGRFLRDCGNMQVSLGSIRSQSPVAGGLQLRSQDVVKYIVNVPNVSGTLAPGQGSIVAGLHGYFWPRK